MGSEAGGWGLTPNYGLYLFQPVSSSALQHDGISDGIRARVVNISARRGGGGGGRRATTARPCVCTSHLWHGAMEFAGKLQQGVTRLPQLPARD